MNLGAFGRLVKDLADSLVNRRERLGARAFIDGLKRDVRQAFMTATDPVTGVPWVPVKKKTGRPLIETGLMMNTAIVAADSAVPSGWGVTVTLPGPPYAFFHQHGTRRLPQRRFWGVSPATMRDVGKNTKQDIVKLTVAH